MESLLYSKYSRERSRQFQLQTNIVCKDGYLVVQKLPYYEEGFKHINKMEEYYSNDTYFNNQLLIDQYVSLCPCLRTEKGLEFDYVEGKSLESQIELAIENEDLNQLIIHLETLNSIVHLNDDSLFFENDEFNKIFGFHSSILNGLSCKNIVNLDLIIPNILFNDKINIIDYEWIFYFKIPSLFVLFRSLLHNSKIQELDSDTIKKIYEYFKIDENLYATFIQMETAFQLYVLGDLKENYKNILLNLNQRVVSFPSLLESKSKKLSLFKIDDENIHLIFEKKYFDGEIEFTLYGLKGHSEYLLRLSDEGLVYNFETVEIQATKDVQLTVVNAQLYENDTYFHESNADWRIVGEFKKLKFKLRILFSNDEVIPYLISLRKDIRQSHEKINIYENSKIYKIFKKLRRSR